MATTCCLVIGVAGLTAAAAFNRPPAGGVRAEARIASTVDCPSNNVSTLDVNLKLSQARADAVVQALVTKHGIASARLVGRGVGPLAPVASNDADEGRARNRRVELVKQ